MPTIIKIFAILCVLTLMWSTPAFSQAADSDDELGLRVQHARVLLPSGHAVYRPSPQTDASAAEMLRRNKVPFSVLFKYDTSWNNPAHRCYEILRPITPTFILRFNLVSLSQCTVGRVR